MTEADVVRQDESTAAAPLQDWVLFTRTGTPATAGAFVEDEDAPLGTGSLQLKTATSSEKVFLFNHEHIGTPLGAIDEIAYSTNRVTGTGNQLAALNVVIDFNGPAVAGGFATLVFEPVYNLNQQAIANGQWQDWIADGSGIWWSTQPIAGQCAGATSACDKTWDEIVTNNPDAVVTRGVGVNQGSGNAGLNNFVDAFTFDETTYDFELVGDSDGDGVKDDTDNCVDVANSDQADADGDGTGDACEPDTDSDGVIDDADNCDEVPNPGQENVDGDSLGDACDPDNDNDGLDDTAPPTDKDQCKNNGFKPFNNPSFKNQGECVSYVATRQ